MTNPEKPYNQMESTQQHGLASEGAASGSQQDPQPGSDPAGSESETQQDPQPGSDPAGFESDNQQDPQPGSDPAGFESEMQQDPQPGSDPAGSESETQQDPQPGGPTKAERLAEVAQRASVCVACPLAQTRTNVVFGEGNPEAPLVLIGEGPGANEDATGRPFVGKAGLLLDACLLENGITRKHIYICNVVRCRACTFEAGRAKNRPPTPDEASACRPWLEQTLEIIRPLVILSLGAPSANVIIHKNFRMLAERGQWFESPYAHHAMAALHPSYVLRHHGAEFETARKTLTDDIAAARAKVIELMRIAKGASGA